MKRMSDTILLILFGILFLIVGFLLYRQYSGYKMFVNLVSGNEISSKMGLNFALKQLELGIPVTILLNGEAAKLALENDKALMKQKDILKMTILKGAKVYVCQNCLKECLKQYTDTLRDSNTENTDVLKIIDGIESYNMDLINKDLLQMNTKTLTW